MRACSFSQDCAIDSGTVSQDFLPFPYSSSATPKYGSCNIPIFAHGPHRHLERSFIPNSSFDSLDLDLHASGVCMANTTQSTQPRHTKRKKKKKEKDYGDEVRDCVHGGTPLLPSSHPRKILDHPILIQGQVIARTRPVSELSFVSSKPYP